MRSGQKGLDEIQRIRAAMEGGNPVIPEAQLEFIKRNAALLGEDGNSTIQDIQTEAELDGCLPADIFKLIERCCQDLNKRVASLEISNEVIRERETERLTQVEAMREQVTKFSGARAKGDNAGLMRVKLALNDMLEKYMKDVDKDEEDGLAPDVVKTWKDQVYMVVKKALEFFGHFSGEDLASKPEDSLAPLRKSVGAVTHLAEAVARRFRIPARKGCGTSPESWGPQKRK